MKRIPEVRLIAFGVDPEIRARGISALVTKSMTDQWHKYSRWVFGWIAEDNLASMDALDRALPLRKYKTYQVYGLRDADRVSRNGNNELGALIFADQHQWS